MRPQIIVYSLISSLFLSAPFLSAVEVEENRSRQESAHIDDKIQQPPATPADSKSVNENTQAEKGARWTAGEQAQVDDMQSEFNKFREETWDDRYRY